MFLRFRVWNYALSDPVITRRRVLRHPTGSRALAQARQHLQARVTVRLHADLLLESEDRLHGVGAGAAVDAVDLITLLFQPGAGSP